MGNCLDRWEGDLPVPDQYGERHMVSGYRAQIKVPREFFVMILEFFIMTLECFHGSVISYFPSVDEMVLIARFCAKGRLYTLIQSLYAKIKNTTCCACDNLLIKPCRNRDDIILVLYVSFFCYCVCRLDM